MWKISAFFFTETSFSFLYSKSENKASFLKGNQKENSTLFAS